MVTDAVPRGSSDDNKPGYCHNLRLETHLFSLIYTAIDHTDEILLLCRASTCTAALDGARQWLHGDEPHHPLDWHPEDLEVPHETSPPALSDRANAYATTGVRRQSVHVYVQHTGRPLSCESDHEPRHM